MTHSILDMRFGWRWLLPLPVGWAAALYGFAPEEEAFWTDEFTVAGLVRRASRAEVLIVNGDYEGRCGRPSSSDLVAAQVVCVIASGRRARRWRSLIGAGFPLVQEYGLLPSGNPRVVVPLDSPRHVAEALRLHRPGRWILRLGLWVAAGLASIGNFVLLRQRVLFVATRERGLQPFGAVQAGLFERFADQDMNFTLYLGTPDDNRKTVVLPLGSSAPEIILKVAVTQRARASLANEVLALEALRKSAVASCVPKLAGVVAAGNTFSLYQEYRPRQRLDTCRMASEVVKFLAQLSLIGGQMVPLSDLLATLTRASSDKVSDKYPDACRALRARLALLGERGISLWLNRSHGDFAPWNCAWTARGLFVYDWEESREVDLALGDAFSYVIASDQLLRCKAKVDETLMVALRFGDRVGVAAGLTELDTRVYLAMWLLRRVDHGGLYSDLLLALDRSWQ